MEVANHFFNSSSNQTNISSSKHWRQHGSDIYRLEREFKKVPSVSLSTDKQKADSTGQLEESGGQHQKSN